MVFDQALRREPSVEFAPEYDPHTQPDGGRIQALFYEGMAYHGKSTRVFAYLGVPNGAERAPVPAVVLVHGGGGHAYYEWVRRWVAKGYAAIAMDTEGYFPADAYKGLAGGFEGEPPETYTRFDASDAYASIPSAAIAGVRVCEHPDTPLEDQWLYHAVSVVLMAQTVLKNDSRVQADRIGICGISWGSVISSIAIGQGSGFAFAVNIYGSAYLEHSLAGIMQAYHRISPENYQSPTATVQNITCFSADSDIQLDRPAGLALAADGDELVITDNSNGGTIRIPVKDGTAEIWNVAPTPAGGKYRLLRSGKPVADGTVYPTGQLRMIRTYGDAFNIRDKGGWPAWAVR